MAILGVSSYAGSLWDAGDPTIDLKSKLAETICRIPKDAPIVIMIHGYRYHPKVTGANPHDLLFSELPRSTAYPCKSWPVGLGFRTSGFEDGLAIGFAWEGLPAPASTRVASLNKFARVYAQAACAGEQLAQLLGWIEEIAPGKTVDFIAHSLGARVVFCALAQARAQNPGRVVLMGGAEYASVVDGYFQRDYIHPRLEVFSMQNRRNIPVDLLFECFAPRGSRGDYAIGRGYCGPEHRWLNISMDNPETLEALDRRGVAISKAAKFSLVDHWAFYASAGVMSLYQGLIRKRHHWPLPLLRHQISAQPSEGGRVVSGDETALFHKA